MTLKTKLTLGLGFLFIIIFTLAGFCSYYVGNLGHKAENILKDNYDSIVYYKNMISAYDDMRTSVTGSALGSAEKIKKPDYYQQLFESGKNAFEINLKAENNNITEVNEKGYVEQLNKDYEAYLSICLELKKGVDDSSMYFSLFLPAGDKLKQSLTNIYDVNIQAIVRKSQTAKQDSARFLTYMALTGSICIVLAMGYLWYFPFYISRTLSYLSERMINLLKKNGIPFESSTNDEAYILLDAIKTFEKKMKKSWDGEE